MKNFTNLYPVQKTLRFELKPVGETAERIEEFKNQALINIVKRDEKRAVDYKKMKNILDDYYRYFIEEVLKRNIFTSKDLETAFDCFIKYTANKSDDKIKKSYQEMLKSLRKKVSISLINKLQEFHLDESKFSELINTKGMNESISEPYLAKWLKERLKNNEISENDLNEGLEAIEKFNQFTSYFRGFLENRKNMFSEDEQKTAISNRIVHENMIKNFNNCIRFENIKQNHKELFKQLESFKEYFKPSGFSGFLNQNGITEYNEKLGRKAEDIYEKGINQLINEYRQKNALTSRDIPNMIKLYKQILSDVPGSLIIDKFESDKELCDTIETLYSEIQKEKYLQQLRELIEKYITKENAETIYIKADSLTDISQKIFGDWSLTGRTLNIYFSEMFSNKKDIEKALNAEAFNIQTIQTAIDNYLKNNGNDKLNNKNTDIAEYFCSFSNEDNDLINKFNNRYEDAASILSEGHISADRRLPDKSSKGGEGFLQIEKIKQFLDCIMEIIHFARPLYLFKKGTEIEAAQKNSDFYDSFNTLFDNLFIANTVYNKTRNYLTKKPYSTDKFKINFDRSTLLGGWDLNKEDANLSVLLLKDNKYYLGIMNKNSNFLFNGERNKELLNYCDEKAGKDCFLKMNYKLLPSPSKMLPKVFFAEKNLNHFAPDKEILKIRDKGLYKKDANDKESVCKWIDFCKDSIKKHKEWDSFYNFKFRPTNNYADVSEFYREVAEQGYSINFTRISNEYINKKVESGELFLFEIYSKDFSEHSNGKPNLHTLYWKAAFSEENLKDVVIKLNGEAEIFFRPASIDKKDRIIHKANKAIENKNPLNKKRESLFEYDLVKDRRFTKDKFFFHCPLTLNFKAQGMFRFNENVNKYLESAKDINFIGIDRGERHLLYYSVINSSGKILEQNSFNTIQSTYSAEEETVEKKTDYHSLLNEKEKQRDEARKSWSSIENIKELKSGYLSHIVHKLAELMEKHNAVIVLEDLNFGFKRGRFKIEKQVYQKFEKALIEKLNYLVFKNKGEGEPGHHLKAYQLTAPFESFDKLGKQSGFLFYVPAGYTSKIDPATGFVNLLKPKYESVEKSKEFFKSFDSVKYNKQKDYFEFTLDYKDISNMEGRTKWTVCSFGSERYSFNPSDKEYVNYNITEELKSVLNKNNISFEEGNDILNKITENDNASFFKSLIFYLGILLKLRYTYKTGEEEIDYILSPVADSNGNFFDSRAAKDDMPKDADANGAYHIALKGIMMIKGIKDGKLPKTEKGRMNADWFEFVQSRNTMN